MREVPYPLPGQILLHEFLVPLGISQYRLAKELGVPQRRIGEIITGKRAITVDTGLRLSRFFGMSDQFWTGLQLDYEANKARDEMTEVLAKIRPWGLVPMPVQQPRRARTPRG
jgi:antitoxin HigA-1